MRTWLTSETWVDYYEQWLPSSFTQSLFAELLDTMDFEQHSVTVFGRVVPQPRLISWCGVEPYRYSGLTLPPRTIPQCLTDVLRSVVAASNTDFNHVLLNLYRSGQDSMGTHSDSERELGTNPVVATLTLGAARKFVLRARRRQHRSEYMLGDGSLLIMGGRCQSEYVHGIPKTRQVVGSRLSLTFRRVEASTRNLAMP